MPDTAAPERLVWLDLEMTGLDPERDTILEIALVVTDAQLNLVATGPNLAIQTPAPQLQRMDAWNRSTHQNSGLVRRARTAGVALAEAERQSLDFVKQHLRPQSSPLCGNSIHQDRRFLRRYMPRLEQFFHYRNLDVSSLKILAQMWAPAEEYNKSSAHTALSDTLASIDELKYWRQRLMKI